MAVMRVGFYLAVALAFYATWASHGAGYPIEVAMLRGVVAFMGASLVAYVGGLVVATAPPPPVAASDVYEDDDGYEDDDTGTDDEDDETSSSEVARPTSRLPAQAAPDRRAA